MTFERRRCIAATVLAASAAMTLSACGSSFGAQTNKQYQPAIGANVRTGPVQVLNGLFVDNGDGSATFSGGLLNTSGDTVELTKATVSTASRSDISAGPDSPIELPNDRLFTVGRLAEIFVSGASVKAGSYVTLTMTLSNAGEIVLRTPVVARDASYDTVGEEPAALMPADAATG